MIVKRNKIYKAIIVEKPFYDASKTIPARKLSD